MSNRLLEKYYPNVYLHFTYDEKFDQSLFEKHVHDFYELIYILRGNGQYIVEGTKYELRPGTLSIFRPGEYHSVTVESGSEYERCVIHFSAESLGKDADLLLSDFKKAPFGQGNFYSEKELTPDIHRIFERLRASFSLPEEKADALVRLLIGELLVSLSVMLPLSPNEADTLGARAIRYLGKHIAEPLSLDSLSKQLLTSKFHLCRAFKQYNGISIQQYIVEKRVMLAKEYIAEGMKPAEAAFSVGFSNYSSFYRAYKKMTGHSPKSERKSV